MAINPLKIVLLAAGGSAAVATIAYVSGALDPYLAPPAVMTTLPAPAASAPAEPKAPEPAKPEVATPAPASVQVAPTVVAPTFDVVRVEGNGSVVIAGKAVASAMVEIVTGSQVIGAAVAGVDGDFAVVLDKPLKPGDYQIVLRSTAPGNVVATSTETAVVSVPEQPGGQVLALVEEPGKPAELITVPAPAKVPTTPPPADKPAATAPAASAQPTSATPGVSATQSKVAVEAVEIEGKKIFIAGAADAGRKVRAYANEILIGETLTSPEGRFLIEAQRELPVGDYIVRVDALEPDGVKVVARAAVPFTREPGEAIAAVAPEQPAAPQAQAGETPAEVANAPATPAEVAPDATAPKLQAVNSAVIIRRGDSLWRISRRVYGYGMRFSTIYLANQDQISDPDRIWPGQVFRVPEKSKEGEAANLDAMGEQALPAPRQ